MSYKFESFNAQTFREYTEFLASRLHQTVSIPFKKILIDGAETTPNHCHDNVTHYIEDNPNFKRKNGWLALDLAKEEGLVMFYAHAVIEDEHGNLYDITLRDSEERQFIESFLSDEQFKIISHDRGITKLRYNCE